MAEGAQEPDKKTRTKISDDELTSRAIEEIFREVHVAEIRSREFGSDKWAACPLRKTNKRFLTSTLRSVEVHNKRRDRQIKQSSDDKLKEIAMKSESELRESYSERREHRRRRRDRSNDNRSARNQSESRRTQERRTEPFENSRHHTYEPPSAVHPAQYMYYYPPQTLTPLPAALEEPSGDKRTKKRKKKSTEARRRLKRSKTKDKKRGKLKKKKKSSKKRRSSTSEPEDCYEVVNLTD